MQARNRIRISISTGVVAFATAGAVVLPATAPASGATPATTAAINAASQGQNAATSQTAALGVVGSGKRKRVPASVSTGPSKWRGGKLRHPNGQKFHWRVKRWANLVRAVMYEHGVKRRFLRGILAQVQQESAGYPDAVNRWDSNAKNGTPSKGLLQVIAPTYRANAKPGYRRLRYQTVPYTNIWAALNYVKRYYGMKKFRYWNRGYNQGY